MKRFFLLTLASAALLGASAAPVKTYEVKSPDGRLALVLTAGERLSFTVAADGETLVAPSEMALTLSTGEVLGESPRVRSARRRAVTPRRSTRRSTARAVSMRPTTNSTCACAAITASWPAPTTTASATASIRSATAS